jgi:Protein of unknown function (DUF1214)
MYNAKKYFVDNPINRNSIGDHTLGLKYNTDGSADIYIQHDSPGKDRIQLATISFRYLQPHNTNVHATRDSFERRISNTSSQGCKLVSEAFLLILIRL